MNERENVNGGLLFGELAVIRSRTVLRSLRVYPWGSRSDRPEYPFEPGLAQHAS